MAILLVQQGPEPGRQYPLADDRIILGRHVDSSICLSGRAISRHHARVVRQGTAWFVEDLDSSNGTYLNGKRLRPHAPAPFNERDTLQLGPYVLALRTEGPPEPNLVVRESLPALTLSQGLLGLDPAHKLQVVLEISRILSRTLDLDPLLDRLLEQLLTLFPQADRSLAILVEGEHLVVRGQHGRGGQDVSFLPFSRTIVRHALDEGVGLLSDDVLGDERFQPSATLTTLGLQSVLCVPLIDQEGRRLGVLQLDRFRKGLPFRLEDLHLLTTIGLQVAIVLENAALQEQRLQEQKLHQELATARDIQQAYLPTRLEGFADADFDILGRVFPARQVAGDFFDFFPIGGGRLAFFLGDVSGKGMPAALFMVAVRTLCRHLAKNPVSPAETLRRLNAALADDNPSCLFVTLIHGLYHPGTGEIVLASGGHPPPLLRRADGTVDVVPLKNGRLIGYEEAEWGGEDRRWTLQPGDLLFFYTDGLSEARAPGNRTLFGLDRLQTLVHAFAQTMPLEAAANRVRQQIEQFTSAADLQDDLTVLLLRRDLEE